MRKLHSRCHLVCGYRYMDELAERSARTDPATMDPATFDLACTRIAEHAAAPRLPTARVVLHRGEPLLLGADRLAVVTCLQAAMPPGTRAGISIQTNTVPHRLVGTQGGRSARS